MSDEYLVQELLDKICSQSFNNKGEFLVTSIC